MRRGVFLCAALVICSSASPPEHATGAFTVGEFEIGRRTFFDFGAAVQLLRNLHCQSFAGGVSVKRTTLTPPADEGFVPEVEVASASISKSTAELLDSVNPCTIPEKELRRELKRCKKCLVFSDVEVVM